MTTFFAQRLQSVRPAESERLGPLRVVPIVGASTQEPPYRLLEADALERVRVTEVDESGQVPVLVVENMLDQRVYLMDGQELIGAKQNRILNTDVLVPANAKLRIPVSCVEAGRWGYNSRHFSLGKTASHNMRARKSPRVHESLKQSQCYDADQGAVWNDVDRVLFSVRAHSASAAMNDAYESRRQQLDDARNRLKLPDDVVGLAVMHDDRLLGLDLFDRHSTLKYFWDSLIDSYAIDWIASIADSADDTNNPDLQKVDQVLAEVAEATWERFDSPGEGDDHRLEHEHYTGSMLSCQDQSVLHLQVFARPEQYPDETERHESRRPRIQHSCLDRRRRRDHDTGLPGDVL